VIRIFNKFSEDKGILQKLIELHVKVVPVGKKLKAVVEVLKDNDVEKVMAIDVVTTLMGDDFTVTDSDMMRYYFIWEGIEGSEGRKAEEQDPRIIPHMKEAMKGYPNILENEIFD